MIFMAFGTETETLISWTFDELTFLDAVQILDS